MAVKRSELSADDRRKKLLAKFWVLAKDIGKDYAYECAASLYPRKVSCIPNAGMHTLTIEELEAVVYELWVRCGRPEFKKKATDVKQHGQTRTRRGAPACAPHKRQAKPQYNRKDKGQTHRSAPTRGKTIPQPTGKPVSIPEWNRPASAWQTEKINELADELKISDAYLLGVLKKANGGIELKGELTVHLAQNVIEALKAIKRSRAMFNNYQPIPKRK